MHAHINKSGGVVGAIPYDSIYESLYFIKYKNDMHVPAAL